MLAAEAAARMELAVVVMVLAALEAAEQGGRFQ
jgi:hypothetical protein